MELIHLLNPHSIRNNLTQTEHTLIRAELLIPLIEVPLRIAAEYITNNGNG